MAPSAEVGYATRLASIRYAGPDVSLFEFAALDAAPLPEPEPGAHIDVRIGPGLVRQYSLVTPLSTRSSYVVAVRREADGRGGSRRLHDECRVGATFTIGGPRNHFALDERAGRTLLIAGGIGITPVYSMFARLRALGRAVELHYWCRSAGHVLFRAELEGRPGVTLHYSGAPDRAGGSLAAVLDGVSDDTEVYCCGPARMLDDFARLTAQRPPERNHVERFAAAAVSSSVEAAATAGAGTFVVTLRRSGVDVQVREGESILGALMREHIDVSYSCEEGVCGACETRVLGGQPLHRDAVRAAAEHERRGTMMICCSGSRSPRLELDL